ncbi:hypothetical protein [Actinoplanes awajinensis]|uniref:DNA-binding protein n=1 Tax=Actinoplanes awajinensis subsp. mycoplanecinus TaxID=135947 RepID=A0A101JJE2_9ACTN|nr:hypothetical protein [Actinoplanes awajinensis]KUL27843.1 hypothetical protein ADL15_33965 [Actinoplanes awajinensis subsp. mycoplanecinus]
MSTTLLEAGAILPGRSTDATLDTMTARAYRHPALDGRTVVRLTGATVGPAEDLSMEFLGFQAAGVTEVGHGRRHALGFPAWALVHDPANGRHALAMVKDMEKLARTARNKPGNARDGYLALAQRLGDAAPQFLPTFWEQAGRAFLAVDNQRMAGTCFTDARRAEQVHGLTVDEDRLRDVHLEFAFGGALTAAMLTAYSREVVTRRTPAEAYQLVRSLALQRVAGGLAPHASMAADLARLAKAAGLDAEVEADTVVALTLTYPATARAHPAVWKAYRKNLVRLGKRDAAVRARLLEIVPDPPGWDTDIRDQWLELLDATGAAADLTSPAVSGVSAARWLARFLAIHLHHRAGRRHAGLLDLAGRMTRRLIAEGGVTVATDPWQADVDLVDVLRAGGVPVRVGPADAHGFHIRAWADDAGAGRRDLAAVAADPELRPLLRRGVRRLLASFRGDDGLADPPLPAPMLTERFSPAGVREVLVELIGDLAGRAGAGGVAGLEANLITLGPLWSAAGVALAPDAFGRLPAVDVAAVLGRTLRAGSPAELTWPAYERAAARLERLEQGVSWPDLVLHDQRTAQVISPDGRVTEHVFRIPSAGHRHAPGRWSRTSCLAADGELLVCWSTDDGQAGYWSSHPDEVIEGEWQLQYGLPLPLPGGGLTTGQQPVHAGDARIAINSGYAVASDGTTYWRREQQSGARGWQWREFDPRTGQAGRISRPAFFAAAGDELMVYESSLRPLLAAFDGTPLGRRDGLAGWRLTRTSEGVLTGTGIDGRQVTLLGQHSGDWPIGAVSLPGTAAPLPITSGHHGVRLWTADGEHLLATESLPSATLPPLDWWHALRTRDEAGSAALRVVDDATAAALLTVADTVTGPAELHAAATANLAAHLPAITDATLRDRIAGVVTLAVRLRRRLAEVTALLGRQPERASRVPLVADDALRAAWAGLCDSGNDYRSTAPDHQFLEQVAGAGALLAGAPDPAVPLPTAPAEWVPLLAGLGALALRAASPATGDDDRAALSALLGTIAGTPLDGSGPPIRLLEVVQEARLDGTVDVYRDGGRTLVLFAPNGFHRLQIPNRWNHRAIQAAPDGVFALPSGPALFDRASARPSGRLAGDRLRTFLTLLAERGPAPWRPEAADALAEATGMGRAEAVLLLAGLPDIATWRATYLTTQQRAAIGVAQPPARIARTTLQKLSMTERVALLDAAMPADPVDLWERGPDVASIAAAWIALRGRRVAVPEQLVGEVARLVNASRASTVLQAIAGPGPDDWLNTDGRCVPRGNHWIVTEAERGVPFTEEHLHLTAIVLPWLAYSLSWDDPLRGTLPEALRLIRERLRNPHLLVGSMMHRASTRPDAGPAVVDGVTYNTHVVLHLVPAHLTGPDDPAIGFVDDATATALRILLSPEIDEALSTPDGATGDPHDPRVSVPGLVAQVQARHGLDADAATYYLQLLALPDPADKAVQKWNGWKPAALRTVQAALIDSGLVVTAKRERAGRPVFLPGGWHPDTSPRLPVETWKLPMYTQMWQARLVIRSLPGLFGTAWARVTDGDLPRYHDLEETR